MSRELENSVRRGRGEIKKRRRETGAFMNELSSGNPQAAICAKREAEKDS